MSPIFGAPIPGSLSCRYLIKMDAKNTCVERHSGHMKVFWEAILSLDLSHFHSHGGGESCSSHLIWVAVGLELQGAIIAFWLRPRQSETVSLYLWNHDLYNWYKFKAASDHLGATWRKPVWDWNETDTNRAPRWKQSPKTTEPLNTVLPRAYFISWTIKLGQPINPPFWLKGKGRHQHMRS